MNVSWDEARKPRTRRAQLLLEALADGEPHSRADVFARVGYLMTNNAASELREAGFNVAQHRQRIDGRNVYFYELVDLPESDGVVGPSSDSGSSGGAGDAPETVATASSVPLTLEDERRPASPQQEQLSLMEAA